MAMEFIDLPGHAGLHKLYHLAHGTQCGHDCQYYEEHGDPLEAARFKVAADLEREEQRITTFREQVAPVLVSAFLVGVVCGVLIGILFSRAV